MVNQQTLQGNWNEIKGKLRTKWGQLTSDELQSFDGNVEQLVGMIQRKTGEAKSKVEKYLEEVSANGSSMLGQAAQTAGEYAQQAAETIQQTSKQAVETVQHGYEETEKIVRQRPLESVAVVFGVGIVVGVLVGLSLRSR